MTYRVFSGPQGAETPSPLEMEHQLFKEFSSLDDAVAWASHLKQTGRTALLIQGDDGTRMTKRDIAEAINLRSQVH